MEHFYKVILYKYWVDSCKYNVEKGRTFGIIIFRYFELDAFDLNYVNIIMSILSESLI